MNKTVSSSTKLPIKPEPAGLGTNVPTSDVRLRLDAAERSIKASLNTATAMFVKVGEELDRIRSERLYRENFSSFDEYCLLQWSWSSSRVRQHISASRTVRSFGLNGALPLGVTNDRQIRALHVLPPEHRLEAWNKALNLWNASAPKGRDMPARHVEQIARRLAVELGLPVPVNGEELGTIVPTLAPEADPEALDPALALPPGQPIPAPARPSPEARDEADAAELLRIENALSAWIERRGSAADSGAAADLRVALEKIEIAVEKMGTLKNLHASRS